jgi:RNA polymerase sigma factor (sigma-70 family)
LSVNDRQILLTSLAEGHGEALRRFLLVRVRNSADIPDLVQEVFLRMLRVPDHEAIRSPEAYLFTVAQHVAQQHSLRQAAAPPSVEVGQVLSDLYATPESDPLMQTSADQCLERLDRVLEGLSPKVRATFILQRHHGLSLEEVSERLGISFPMAKKYLAKALLRFRQHLDTKE